MRVILWLALAMHSASWAQDVNPEARSNYENGVQSNDLGEKIKFFERAVGLQPDYLEAVYLLGVTYFQKAQYDQAIKHLSRSIELNGSDYKESKPYLRNAYTFKARALDENGQPESALAFALEATQLDDSFAPAHTALGLIQFNLQNWESAVRAFNKSIRLNPNQEDVWTKLGDIYFRIEDYPQAILAYERAINLDPDLKDAQVHLKIALKRATPQVWISAYEKLQSLGRNEEAISALKRANIIYPGDEKLVQKLQEATWETDYLAADAAVAIGNHDEALQILQKIDPGYKDVTLKMAELQAILSFQRDSLAKAVAVTGKERVPSKPRPAKLESQSAKTTPKKTPPAKTQRPPVVDKEPSKNAVVADSLSASVANGIDTVATNHLGRLSSGAVKTNNDSLETISDIPKESKTPSKPFTPMHWIAAGLSGLLLLGLVLMKFAKPTWAAFFSRMQNFQKSGSARRSRHYTPSDKTIDFFKDRVASITPVKFDPVDTTNVVDKRRKKISSIKMREALPLEETQTILGGIKRIKRIGRYILEKEIGRGTMGLIYKAWDPKLDRTVVIKQVMFDSINSVHEVATLKDRLFREARAAGRLNHPNIVIIYDVDEDRDFSYIVMEYLQGKDLKLLLEREIRFDLPRTINIISQICSALDYAHQLGIVHRDIKPSNIILTQNNHVKVADFGIAKLPHFGTLTQTGSIIGTPYYMSPEQIEGRKLDGRSDLFSVGVILYEMLAGSHPFAGETIPSVVYKIVNQQPKAPSTIREDLPLAFDEIVARALSKDPEARYTTALDLIIDLESVQGELLRNEV
ncbi:MAG TPA: protein kinase [bacterium]